MTILFRRHMLLASVCAAALLGAQMQAQAQTITQGGGSGGSSGGSGGIAGGGGGGGGGGGSGGSAAQTPGGTAQAGASGPAGTGSSGGSGGAPGSPNDISAGAGGGGGAGGYFVDGAAGGAGGGGHVDAAASLTLTGNLLGHLGSDGNNGSGGGTGAGGGGGGLVLTSSNANVTTGSYSVTGGAGGNGYAGSTSGGGGGGAGLVLLDGGMVTVNGGSIISGGAGGAGTFTQGGGGGAGLFLYDGGTLQNAVGSTITGGNGGSYGGAGGAGVLGNGATITNDATISGGNGGTAGFGYSSGSGGAGVAGTNLTIVNGGSIAGGMNGDGGTRANAITFTGGANTLSFTASGLTGGVANLTGGIAINGAGSLTVDLGSMPDSITIANAISGDGSLIKSSATYTSLILSGANTYTGKTTVTNGALSLSGVGSIASSSELDLAASGTLFFIGGTSGTGTTIKTLSGVTGSIVYLGAKTLTISQGSTTYAGAISESGGLTVTGGTQTLSGTNTYTGNTTITGGTLALSGGGSIAASSKVDLTAAGATFDIANTTAGATIKTLSGVTGSTVELGAKTLTISDGSTTYAGSIAGSGGGLTVAGGTQVLSGTNTYTGGTTLHAGTLSVSQDANLGDAGGTLTFFDGGKLQTTASFSMNRATSMDGVGGTFDVGTGTTLTQAGAISGSNALTKAGAGTLVLSGTNSYDGGTVIGAGTLSVSYDANLGDAAGTLTFNGGTLRTTADLAMNRATTIYAAGGGTFNVDAGTTLTQAGAISGSDALTKAGTGTLTLTGASTLSGGSGTFVTGGGLVLDGGSLRLTSNFAALTVSATGGGTADLTLQNGGTVSLTGGGGTLVYVGRNGGSGSLTITGSGSRLDNTNTSIGNAGAGTLSITGGGALSGQVVGIGSAASGTATAIVSGAGSTLTASAGWDHGGGTGLSVGSTGSMGTLTIADGALATAGNAYLALQGGQATLNLNGTSGSRGVLLTDSVEAGYNNSFTAGSTASLVFDGGILRANADTAGTHTGDVLKNFTTGKGTITINGGGAFLDTNGHTVSTAAIFGGVGGFTKQGAGTLTLSGASTYIGGTTVDGGTLTAGAAGAFVGNTAYTVNSGTLDLNGYDLTMSSLSGTGGTVALGTANLTVAQAANTSFAGVLSGTGGFTKSGAGSLTLTGDSSFFSGATTVSGGKLVVANALSGSASVTGGSLVIDGALNGSVEARSAGVVTGSGIIAGTVDLTGGGVLSGASGQTLRIGNNVVMDSTSVVNVALGAPSSLFAVGGDLGLNGTLNVTDAGGFGAGVYRLFNYGGSLTNDGLSIGSRPAGVDAADLAVQTVIAGQVNLISTTGAELGFWDGGNAALHNNGIVDGGAGVWSADGSNWTQSDGALNGPFKPNPTFAVFQGNSGILLVDMSAGTIGVTGMQFAADGYRVEGDSIALQGSGGTTTIRVGDGTTAGANMTATIASALTGASTLVKSDYGTLILTGANSYTGGTQVVAGTLVGNAGSIRGDIANAGRVEFDQAADASFAGNIAGLGGTNGAMVKSGAGNLTLTGASSLDWAIKAGGLSTDANRFTGNAAIQSGANLTFDQSANATYAGIISGSGAFTKAGSGSLTLTGNSSAFTGTTDITAGLLSVNGQLGGALNVIGGKLGGSGTIGNLTLSGIVAPGNSIGTLNVGNIIFNAGSIYQVEVNAAGQSDRIAASGTATISGGSVEVLAGSGDYAPQTRYTILTAVGGRTGTFTEGVTSNLAFLDPSLSYDASNVYLTMTRNDISFVRIGQTANQIATAAGVESLDLGNPVYNAVLNLSAPQAQHAFDQLSGEIHASAKTAMIEDSRFIRNAVNDRIRAAFDGVGASPIPVMAYRDGGPQFVPATTDRFAVWGQGFGSWGNANGNAARLDRSTSGFFFGADTPVFDTWRFGAVAGYSRSTFDVKDRRSSGWSDNYHVGLYGGTRWGALALRAGTAYTWHDMSTSRSVSFPGFGDSLKGDSNAGTAQVFGELGYGIHAGNLAFEPFANLAYISLNTDGFSEKGGAAALSSQSATTDATFTTLGLRVSTTFDLSGASLTAKGTLGWRHAFGDVTPLSAMRFAGGDVFTVAGVPIARDAAVVEAGLDYALSSTATLGITYGGQFGSGATDQSFRANFNVTF